MRGRIIVFTEFKDTAYQIYSGLQSVLEKRINNIPVRYVRRANQLKREILSSASSPNDAAKFIDVLPLPGGDFIGFALLTSESKKYLPIFQSMLDDRRFATVVLISTDVAAEGLNMQSANILVNYEVTWSPLKRDQRIGRVWRLGQNKDVYVFDFHVGTDFERSILENFTLKVITIAEHTGCTTLRYGGLAFYIPRKQPGEEERCALRVVELEKFSEGVILDNIASALQRAFTPAGGLNKRLLDEELSRLAVDILRFVRKLRRELESLSRFRSSPERMRREVELLLGFRSEKDAIEAANHMLELLSRVGLVRVQKVGIGNILYVEGHRVNSGSLRDLVDAIRKATKSGDSAFTIEDIVSGKRKPNLVFVEGADGSFKGAFLTLLVAEAKKRESRRSAILYLEPFLIVEYDDGHKLYRGADLLAKVKAWLESGEVRPVDDITLGVLMSKYRSSAMSIAQYLARFDEVLRKKHIEFTRSKQLKEVRIKSPDIIPNDIDPIIRVIEKPVAIFIPTLSAKVSSSRGMEESDVPVLEPQGRVSPEKKERVKTVAEALVKAYFENLGYKAIKRCEYLPYDLELYDANNNLVAYVEVKGHEASNPVAELSENEVNFAYKNKDKYIVCVVVNALSSPRIICRMYKDLKMLKMLIENTRKFIYSIDEE